MSSAPTLVGRLAHLAQTRPMAIALREKNYGVWEQTTWAEHFAAVCHAGAALLAAGMQPGDHIAILSGNRTEWLWADLGTQLVGAVAVGIYQTNPTADVAYVLAHSQTRLLFCEDQEQVDKAIECAAQTPSVERIVVFDPRGLRHYEDERLISWVDFLASTPAPDSAWAQARLAALDPDAPAMVVYTSGTTGQPKGAQLSNTNVCPAADALTAQLKIGPEDTLLSYLPLCHVAEKIFTVFLPLASGAVVHFGEAIETVQEDLREVSPTIFLGVPRIWEKMHAGIVLKMADSSWLKRRLFAWAINGKTKSQGPLGWLKDLLIHRPLQERMGMRRCRLPFSGAAPISEDMLRWFHSAGIPVLEAFGQTECAGVSHLNPPGDVRFGTVGQVIDGMSCRIAEDGEILLHGPPVFVGYLHNAEATAATVDEAGWLHTGDVGQIDADGYLSITGRKKEIIITAGGKNLSPERIENAMKMSPFIKEAVAIGDRRKFIAALIQIDWDAVSAWATRTSLAHTDFADLTRKSEVVDLVGAEIKRLNAHLGRVEQVRAYRLFDKELHQDDGELTATQKVRRGPVAEIWSARIEEMYTQPVQHASSRGSGARRSTRLSPGAAEEGVVNHVDEGRAQEERVDQGIRGRSRGRDE
jgi:long-chain acyl-CoA synthetase